MVDSAINDLNRGGLTMLLRELATRLFFLSEKLIDGQVGDDSCAVALL